MTGEKLDAFSALYDYRPPEMSQIKASSDFGESYYDPWTLLVATQDPGHDNYRTDEYIESIPLLVSEGLRDQLSIDSTDAYKKVLIK